METFNLNRQQRRQLQRQADKENRTWPETLTLIPPEEWQNKPMLPAGLEQVWRSKRFLVQIYKTSLPFPEYARISVQRVEDAAFRQDKGKHAPISWDDLQAIKSQVQRGEDLAIEIYPPDSEIVNVASMRHLWLLPRWEIPWARLK